MLAVSLSPIANESSIHSHQQSVGKASNQKECLEVSPRHRNSIMESKVESYLK